MVKNDMHKISQCIAWTEFNHVCRDFSGRSILSGQEGSCNLIMFQFNCETNISNMLSSPALDDDERRGFNLS